ncbi:alpha-hydroxy acid oxidase [Aspergillus ibericus CBS 121593]|uniref:FMN-dependent alpha-hydroxy acid dehydrogenase n=1 Tax=Aspergillus ibericus CBS 121593 TaxID=1448316 RepID=A0A395H654_9EURO|nr:FMN-dependent alpha-hydroxy acid dehydrogenase [Aspergillus ibericus CBS 121593]RAL02635.1 FMN-dependent alpha-hydroxy acid dehydrogenase [Aspergillus ibericus CBS 121593]
MSKPDSPNASQCTPSPTDDPLTLHEFEQAAKARLPAHIYEFYASGSDQQNALARNEAAFNRLCIRPRVLIDVSEVDTSTTLFGWKAALPIGIAPSAMQRLAGGEGELDVATAAASMGLNLTLSSQSTTSLEDVAEARNRIKTGDIPPPPFWMQIYLYEDVQKSINLIRRAEAAGYQALILTVDTPVLGNRLAERRTAVTLPAGMTLPNLDPPAPNNPGANPDAPPQPSINRQLMNARTAHSARALRTAAGSQMHSSSLTWHTTIPFLRRTTSMKLILKGIMTPEDARLAIQHGIDGIIVSNHGGRQLDATCSTLEALPDIVNAVAGAIPVILDGGVRSGADVFKALAVGADFVLVGRPVLWGLAVGGKEGVRGVMDVLERELSRTMALAGVREVGEIGRERVGVLRREGFGRLFVCLGYDSGVENLDGE